MALDHPRPVNNEQRRELARIVIVQVAELVDIIPDMTEDGEGIAVLDGISREDVAAQLGRWMARLPGPALGQAAHRAAERDDHRTEEEVGMSNDYAAESRVREHVALVIAGAAGKDWPRIEESAREAWRKQADIVIALVGGASLEDAYLMAVDRAECWGTAASDDDRT